MNHTSSGVGIGLGLCLGTALGAATHNVGVGIALGVGLGVSFAMAFGASDTALTRTMDAEVAKFKDGRRISDEPVSLGTIHGRKVEVATPNEKVPRLLRAYATGGRVYFLTGSQAMKDTLDSFAITN